MIQKALNSVRDCCELLRVLWNVEFTMALIDSPGFVGLFTIGIYYLLYGKLVA